MQPSNTNIALSAAPHNRLHTPLLLPPLDEPWQYRILEAFHRVIDDNAGDVQPLLKNALTHLRNQMIGPWVAAHKHIRQSILWIIANSTEAHALAQAVISQHASPMEGRQ